VLGGGLYLTTAALLGLATGTVTRNTGSAITPIFGITLIAPAIAPALPKPLPTLMAKYWPTEAGTRVLATRPDPTLLGPWAGLGVMVAATGAVLVAAFAAFRHRDRDM
jgi:hypothetical protein